MFYKCFVGFKVGYGDIVPTGTWGKIIASFTAMWGIILIALPVAVIGSKIGTITNEERKKHEFLKQLEEKYSKNDQF